MWIRAINLEQLRCFQSQTIYFGQGINILVGKNNAGKSTIIKSIASVQYPEILNGSDVRKGGGENSFIKLYFEGGSSHARIENPTYTFSIKGMTKEAGFDDKKALVTKEEPNTLIYPFFSNRKATNYSESMNEATAFSVEKNNANLPARLSIVSNPAHPNYLAYKDACESLFGRMIGTIPSPNGILPGIYFNSVDRIPITAMGDGVTSMVSLLIDLAIAENKIFLLEEPENDIHPQALKALLDLIIKSSIKNQFIISTHSNIVLKRLGEISNSNIRAVRQSDTEKYISQVEEVGKDSESRRKILNHLGYDFTDEDAFSAWIFFEESSAERLVRDFFIPWYTPSLRGQIRTISAGGISKVAEKFNQFNSLFCYLNLQEKYKNRAWIIVDEGSEEKQILEKLKNSYVDNNGWDDCNFIQLEEHDFENYYPAEFESEVQKIQNQTNKDQKRKLKESLLMKLIGWCNDNEDVAKREFRKTANEIISLLLNVEQKVSMKNSSSS